MPDMLVKLYTLPDLAPLLAAQAAAAVDIRRCIPPEKHLVVDWVRERWSPTWASECDVAFTRQPPACFVAVVDGHPVGFACYDTTARGFFGPIGVDEAYRRRGIGEALLVMALDAMLQGGYGYAIIGGVGPADWYAKLVGATIIPDSTPGVYRGMLRQPPAPEEDRPHAE